MSTGLYTFTFGTDIVLYSTGFISTMSLMAQSSLGASLLELVQNIVFRWLRIIPVYSLVLFGTWFLVVYLNEGPVWFLIDSKDTPLVCYC